MAEKRSLFRVWAENNTSLLSSFTVCICVCLRLCVHAFVHLCVCTHVYFCDWVCVSYLCVHVCVCVFCFSWTCL